MSNTDGHIALTAGGVILATARADYLLLATAGIFLLLYLGVVVPAVFFTDAKRRRDARLVLQQVLDFFRGSRSP